MGHVLALDLGSSSVRAAVLDRAGMPGPVRLARRPVEMWFGPRGEAELEPERYIELIVSCLDELDAAGTVTDVADVAVASQWHSLLALDRHGEPVSPVLTWADTRRRAAVTPPEDPAAFHARTGTRPHWQYWTGKAAWLLGEAPSAVHLVGLPELLGARLFGDVSTSRSMASGTGLLNWSTGNWDDEALAIAGVRQAPLPVLQEGGWSGRLLPQWRRRWPFLADAAWHSPVGDGAAANIGSACGDPSKVNITIGTSSAVRVVEPLTTASALGGGLWRYRVDDKRVVSGVALSSGGGSYSWISKLAGHLPRGAAEHDLARVPLGSNGLTVLPFHAGGRAPRDVPAGRAVISGLGPGTTSLDLVSATIEGVCFELAEAVEAVEASLDAAPAIIACGGAIEASATWQARLAAVLRRPIGIMAVPEASARGAAILVTGEYGASALPLRIVEPREADIDAAAVARSAYEELRSAHGIAPLREMR